MPANPQKKKEFNHLSEVWVLQDFAYKTYTVSQNPSNFKGIPLLIPGHYKAQLVAKGFTQEHSIDYEETFSPMTRYESIPYLLAHATLEDWEIEAMDVKMEYLYGKLKEEIYMAQPGGFIKSGQEHKVCQLVISIYDLKQARWVWYETISKTLQRKLGFQQLHSDAEVHKLHQWEGDHEIILILYVDDLLIMRNSQPMIHSIKTQLKAVYQMKDLGAATSYLGIRITRDWKHRSIWIDQEDYIWNALKYLNLLNANDTRTPLPEGTFSCYYYTYTTRESNPLPTTDRDSPLHINRYMPRYSIHSNKTIKIQSEPYRWASQICYLHPKVSQGNDQDPITLWWIFPCQAYRVFRFRLGQEQRQLSLYFWSSVYSHQWLNMLVIQMTKNYCTISSRSQVHGTSQNSQTGSMALKLQSGNWQNTHRSDHYLHQ